VICNNCGFKIAKACSKKYRSTAKRKQKCDRFVSISPSCSNCVKVDNCLDAYGVVNCKKWLPDYNSPLIKLIGELNNTEVNKQLSGLDDSDFKISKNFLDHCLDRIGIEPFPKQIEEAGRLFVEICYDCSNPDYYSLFDQSLGNILYNVIFLEHGVCPKCKKNRF